MALLEKQLLVKKSILPNAGKGLFTTKAIIKNTRIVEYKGVIKKANEIADKRYTYVVNSDHAIDAMNYAKGLAHFANDANGISKAVGAINNCQYETVGLRIYITAITDIPAGSELFVDYGKKYWTKTAAPKKSSTLPLPKSRSKNGKIS